MVHGVVGVVALGVSAADPGGFQQLVLLLIPPVLLSLPLSLSLPIRVFGVPASEGGVASLPARPGGAVRPPLLLVLPATSLPVSAG